MPKGIGEERITEILAVIRALGDFLNVPQARVDAALSQARAELEGPTVPIPPQPSPRP